MKKLCVIMMVLFVIGQFGLTTRSIAASVSECMDFVDIPDVAWAGQLCMDLALMAAMNGTEDGDVDDLGGWI